MSLRYALSKASVLTHTSRTSGPKAMQDRSCLRPFESLRWLASYGEGSTRHRALRDGTCPLKLVSRSSHSRQYSARSAPLLYGQVSQRCSGIQGHLQPTRLGSHAAPGVAGVVPIEDLRGALCLFAGGKGSRCIRLAGDRIRSTGRRRARADTELVDRAARRQSVAQPVRARSATGPDVAVAVAKGSRGLPRSV